MKIKAFTIAIGTIVLGVIGFYHFSYVKKLEHNQQQQEFMSAIENGQQTKVLEFLNSKNINLNQLIYGNLALTLAAEKGDIKTINLLLQKGANIDLPNAKGYNPLFIAIKNGNSSLIHFLLENGKANPIFKIPSGWTPLHMLASIGKEADIKFLLNILKRITKNIDFRDKYGITPLMYASVKGQAELIKLLLESGANPNAKSNTRMTPLLFLTSARTVNLKGALYLIKSGAQINLADQDGLTPLMAAAYRGHESLVALLTSKGADKNIKNNAGKTAAELAHSRGNRRIAAFLR